MSQHSQQPDQSGFASGLFFGLIIGGALGYWLQTKSGQDLLKKLKQTTTDTLEQLDQDDLLQTKLERAQALVNQLESKFNHSSTRNRTFKKDGQPLKPPSS